LTFGRNLLVGSLIAFDGDSRTVIRFQKGAPSSGRGTNGLQIPYTAPYRSGTISRTSVSRRPRGHQNSSASALMTQSAACSVTAARAIAVCRSP
jgi:hypothetical protein